MGSLNCDLCDLGISRIERGRESEFPPTEDSIRSRESGFNGEPAGCAYSFYGLTARGACLLLLCTHFRDFALIRNKLTFCGNCCILLKYLVGGHC